LVRFRSIKCLLYYKYIFGENLLAHLKQLGEKLKGDI